MSRLVIGNIHTLPDAPQGVSFDGELGVYTTAYEENGIKYEIRDYATTGLREIYEKGETDGVLWRRARFERDGELEEVTFDRFDQTGYLQQQIFWSKAKQNELSVTMRVPNFEPIRNNERIPPPHLNLKYAFSPLGAKCTTIHVIFPKGVEERYGAVPNWRDAIQRFVENYNPDNFSFSDSDRNRINAIAGKVLESMNEHLSLCTSGYDASVVAEVNSLTSVIEHFIANQLGHDAVRVLKSYGFFNLITEGMFTTYADLSDLPDSAIQSALIYIENNMDAVLDQFMAGLKAWVDIYDGRGIRDDIEVYLQLAPRAMRIMSREVREGATPYGRHVRNIIRLRTPELRPVDGDIYNTRFHLEDFNIDVDVRKIFADLLDLQFFMGTAGNQAKIDFRLLFHMDEAERDEFMTALKNPCPQPKRILRGLFIH